jgi:hypothetical protein
MDSHSFVFASLDGQTIGVIAICGGWVTARCRCRSFRGIDRLFAAKIRFGIRRPGGSK